MKKNLFILVLLILILVMGCAKNQPLSDEDFTDDDFTQTASEQTSPECNEARINNAAGQPIYTEKDAVLQFGGSWKSLGIDSRALKSGSSIYGDKTCIFDFKRDADELGKPNYIGVQVANERLFYELIELDKQSSKIFTEESGKMTGEKIPVKDQIEIKNVGDKAILSQSGFGIDGHTAGHHTLFVNKGTNYVIIGCVRKPLGRDAGDWDYNCKDEQLISIGQKIASRL